MLMVELRDSRSLLILKGFEDDLYLVMKLIIKYLMLATIYTA